MLIVAMVPAMLVWTTLLGLGQHRHAPAWAILFSACFVVYAPPLVASFVAAQRQRSLVFGAALMAWSIGLFLPISVYFPGERNEAVATGLGLLSPIDRGWDGMARAVASRLPSEAPVSRPEVPVADAMVQAVPDRPDRELTEDQIELPYEGEGRRLSVAIAFRNGGKERDVQMMLDTGATYTTLPDELLAELGILPSEHDPVIRLHTANGEREARVVLLDEVWLGDFKLEGVSVATCQECATSDIVGLLGLNITGAFNVTIDADERVVVLDRRDDFNRHLDVKPFIDLRATTTRYPGGRVEVEVELDNKARRPMLSGATSITCAKDRWRIDVPQVDPGKTVAVHRRLPPHPRCNRYEVSLTDARW